MEYRILNREEIEFLREIDRGEVIENIYYYRDGRLELEKEFYDMKGFPDGELEDLLTRLYELYDSAGIIYGAFDGEQIIGMTALENKLRGRNKDQLKMDILFVSKDYRGIGIGRKLVQVIKESAKQIGAKKLYISATPSKNTVDFYMKIGSKLAEEVDEELFDIEPEDIHLDLEL